MEPLVSTLVVLTISAAFIAGYQTNAYVSMIFFALALLIGLCMQRAKRGETIEMRRFGRLHRVNEEGYFLFIPLVDSMANATDGDERSVEKLLNVPIESMPGTLKSGDFSDPS
jgi:regulator of protease activity HflC (stomatin/prohibitin superfamily)